MAEPVIIIDEINIWLGNDDPSMKYRNVVLWYNSLLYYHRKLNLIHTHGEIKNLRDLRRQAMKQEVRAGLRPVPPGSVDRVTRPTS